MNDIEIALVIAGTLIFIVCLVVTVIHIKDYLEERKHKVITNGEEKKWLNKTCIYIVLDELGNYCIKDKGEKIATIKAVDVDFLANKVLDRYLLEYHNSEGKLVHFWRTKKELKSDDGWSFGV